MIKLKKIKEIFTFHRSLQGGLFIFITLLTLYFFPREERFRYHFLEGKPWRYGLLTAPFDFPVYKSDSMLQREQQEALVNFQPYYKQVDTVGNIERVEMLKELTSNFGIGSGNRFYAELSTLINTIYSDGIISTADYNQLQKEGIKNIKVLRGNVAKQVPFSTLRTSRMAYSYINDKLELMDRKDLMRDLNLNNYLKENLQYDTIVSQRIKNEFLQKVSLSTGMVQAGERIIDRGEIVSPSTYNILNSLQQVTLRKTEVKDGREITLLGQLIIILILYTFLYLYLYLFRPMFFNNPRKLIFFFLMVTSVVITAFILSKTRILGVYLVPFAIVPIIVRIFLDSRTALFAHIATILFCSFVAPFPLEFVFLQILAGMTAIFSLRDLVRRSQLMRTAFIIFITYCIAYTGYSLTTGGSFSQINYNMYLFLGGNCIMLLFAYLLIYLLEKIFGFVSNVTLVELSDINNPVLRSLSENCPGTFQHSLQVSNLAAEAANKIGANAQLARTGALYHDIGKVSNPIYFTENQIGVDPHKNLTYEQSARIIIGHVKEGVRLAEKHNLPEAVTAFISTHHGTGKAKYFYTSFLNEFPNEPINEEAFTYPGPNPSSRESTIVMLADSVEAASRSLSEYTEESIRALVDAMVKDKINEGLLKNSPLSLRDIERVKEVFVDKLKTAYHTRISYPTLNKPT